MDKFATRRKAGEQRRVFLLGGGFFFIVTTSFVVMFAFGNAAVVWLLGVYVFGMTLAVLAGIKNAGHEYAVWLRSLNVQPRQADGFSALEVAAIHEILVDARNDEAGAWHLYLQYAEVVERYNSGSGCIVSIRSHHLAPMTDVIRGRQVWFAVSQTKVVTGAHIWPEDENGILMLEFFTGGQDTRHWLWTDEIFSPVTDNIEYPFVPLQKPIINAPYLKAFRSI